MNDKRQWHGMCYSSFHRKAYVVFGSNGWKSIESYSLAERTWIKLNDCDQLDNPSDTMAYSYKSYLYITIYNREDVLKFDPVTNKYDFMTGF